MGVLKSLTVMAAALAVLIYAPVSSSGSAPGASAAPSCNATMHVISLDPDVTSVQPPDGFNPLTASDAELACYQLPPRPADSARLAHWSQVMNSATNYIVPVVGDPSAPKLPPMSGIGKTHQTYDDPGCSPTCPTSPWSGYSIPRLLNDWQDLSWNYTEGEWNVPYGHNYCYNNSTGSQVTVWVGMGGDGWDGGNANSIIQAGTDTFDWPAADTEFWWEDYPNPPQAVTNFPVSQGDDVFVEVTYHTDKTTTFDFFDITKDTWTDLIESTPSVDTTSAEFIVEDHKMSWDYVNFGTVPFTDAFAEGTWGSSGQNSISKGLNSDATLAQFKTYKNSSYSTLVAWPTAPDSSGHFTDFATSNDGC
jgi:hypothetical protein